MSVKVARDRFIVSSVTGFYQYLTSNVSGFQELGEKLSRIAEIAQAFRQTERLEELGSILSNFPLSEYRLVGQYYLGWCAYRKGENARSVFESVVEKSRIYKTKALISLAAIESSEGDLNLGLKYYADAIKYADSPSTLIQSARSMVAIRSMEGCHKRALRDLERLLPLIRHANPLAYYQYMNSYAVELGEAGRIQEAQSVCQITLASPYLFAYPEWRETGADVARRGYRSRSSVPVIQSFLEPEKIQNVLQLPERPRVSVSSESTLPAKLLSYLDWKEKMVKEPNGEEDEPKTTSDRLVKLLSMVNSELSDADLDKVIELLKKLHSKKKP